MKRSPPLVPAFVVGPSTTTDRKNRYHHHYHQYVDYEGLKTTKTTTHLSLFSSAAVTEASSSTMSSLSSLSSSYDPNAVGGGGNDGVVFEPVMPQTETLVGMGVIVLLSIVVSWVWANQVVPVSRTKLSIDKNRGELKDYLDELKKETSKGGGDDSETTVIATAGGGGGGGGMNAGSNDISPNNVEAIEINKSSSNDDKNNNRAFERWLFTDWLQDNKSARKSGGRQKDPALPILKDAKWNSGDNPVLAASALIGLCVIVSSVIEKVTSSL